jgi:hypothetical protein
MSAFIDRLNSTVLTEMDRQEMESLTALANFFKRSVPIKISYDDIYVSGFCSGLKADPRPVFNQMMGGVENQVDGIIEQYKEKDSAQKVGLYSWQIKTRFITADICLHYFTKYDCSEFVVEDFAIHRLVLTMSASFDAKNMYRSHSHATDVFEDINHLYQTLMVAIGQQ